MHFLLSAIWKQLPTHILIFSPQFLCHSFKFKRTFSLRIWFNSDLLKLQYLRTNDIFILWIWISHRIGLFKNYNAAMQDMASIKCIGVNLKHLTDWRMRCFMWRTRYSYHGVTLFHSKHVLDLYSKVRDTIRSNLRLITLSKTILTWHTTDVIIEHFCIINLILLRYSVSQRSRISDVILFHIYFITLLVCLVLFSAINKDSVCWSTTIAVLSVVPLTRQWYTWTLFIAMYISFFFGY